MMQSAPMGGSEIMLGVHAVLVAMVGWLWRLVDKLENRVDHRMDRLEDAIWKTPNHLNKEPSE